MSIHEEATVVSQGPMMPVFNNLVLFDQHQRQNSLQSIVPELATEWSWNDDKTQLKFTLRQGVKWHDGKPGGFKWSSQRLDEGCCDGHPEATSDDLAGAIAVTWSAAGGGTR